MTVKNLSRAYQQVLEFYTTKKLPVAVGVEDVDALGSQLDLVEEEAEEVVFASRHTPHTLDDLTHIVKEYCDLLYVALGFFVVLGVDPSDFFDQVHAANMRKTGQINPETGKFVKDADDSAPYTYIRDRLERKFWNES